MIAAITAPSAAASFGGTYQPETPSSTISTRPPCAATITGLRQAIASIATRPNGSGNREGTAQTSAQAVLAVHAELLDRR